MTNKTIQEQKKTKGIDRMKKKEKKCNRWKNPTENHIQRATRFKFIYQTRHGKCSVQKIRTLHTLLNQTIEEANGIYDVGKLVSVKKLRIKRS